MKNIIIKCISLFLIIGFVSCNIDTVENPNGPTQESYANEATLAQLNLLTTGVEAIMRNDMEFYYQTVSIVGREYYDLNGTDPRYTGELLGAGDGMGVLDNNGFLTTRSFSARYRAVRSAQNLISAVENSAAGLDDQGKNGYYSFANTVKAYQLLLVLNRQFQNGIRVDVSDPDNLGPFVSYDEGLSEIRSLLNTALGQANDSGGSFAFDLSSGFDGFADPQGFAQFINALLARVEIYANNKQAALSALDNSFISETGDLNAGVYHVFSGGGNDQLNPLFYALNQNNYMAHPTYVTDAEAGDARLDKVARVSEAIMIDNLSSEDQVQLYASNDAPVGIIRNEELILLRAEALIGSDNTGAIALLNIIRNAYGLSDYGGADNDEALVDELLQQRRYSLFGEGHRWIDMRRYGRLGELPIDRSGDEIFEQFPRPILEG